MDDGSSPIIGLTIFLIFLIISAVLYGFSASIQNISLKAIEDYDDKHKNKAGKLENIIDNPDKFILTVHVVTMFMSMFAGVYEVRILARHLMSYTQDAMDIYNLDAVIYAVCAIMMAIVFVWIIIAFGVLIPKKLGSRYAEKWAFSLYSIAYLIMVILTPVTFTVKKIVNLILRIFGIDPNANEDSVTEEDIVSMVNEGHEQGSILTSEAEMITNIFEFDDKEVKDIMTHRTNIIAVDGTKSLIDTVTFMLAENYSRFPVYEGDIDNIVGIIHLKDTMIIHENGEHDNWRLIDIPGLIRKAEFIPETRNINTVFKVMQSEKLHMQIVIDEYGQTSGIVAMEDILEEIVGNIQDEYDEEEENIVKKEENTYIVNGMTTLEELSDKLGISIEDDDYDTINGYLISCLDRILNDDERPELDIDGYSFKVLEVHNKMISKVQLTMPADEIDEVSQDNEIIEENNEQ